MATRLLILGGTTEARHLGRRLAAIPGYAACMSLAGRTEAPQPQPLPVRMGGFGGAAGLADHLREHAVHALVVATHPFARRIAENAAWAAAETGVPAIRLLRPAWEAAPGDDWRRFPDLDHLVAALAMLPPLRLLVTIGRQEAARFAAAPRHRYLFRAIEAIVLPESLTHAATLAARGPFTLDEEIALQRTHRIDALVTKNSGGEATAAKLAAARALGLPVFMVERPPPVGLPAVVATEAAVMAFLAHHAPPAERGE